MNNLKFLMVSVLTLFSQSGAFASSPSAIATELIQANIPKAFAMEGCSLRLQKRGSGFNLKLADENANVIEATTTIDSDFKEISNQNGLIRIVFKNEIKSIMGREQTTIIELTGKAARITQQIDETSVKSKTCNY